MSYLPSEGWYEDMFDDCKSRKEVEDKAIGIIRSKYQQLYENDEKFQTIAQGHAATIESLINQMY